MKGYAATHRFSPEVQNLWKASAALVELVPEELEVRCHELVRGVISALNEVALVDLTVCDGQFGSIDHSWAWVGKAPPKIPCEFSLGCEWEAMYFVPFGRRHNFRNCCPLHVQGFDTRYPIQREGIVLDTYFPGALPPVALVDLCPGLPLPREYSPGPLRTDLDIEKINELIYLFHNNPVHLEVLCP